MTPMTKRILKDLDYKIEQRKIFMAKWCSKEGK